MVGDGRCGRREVGEDLVHEDSDELQPMQGAQLGFGTERGKRKKKKNKDEPAERRSCQTPLG